MPLVNVDLLIGGVRLPPAAARYVAEAERRIRRLRARRDVPGFIRSDFVRAYHALRALAAAAAMPNRRFCEWGSGLGVVAGLASMLDFHACGIEIDAELVEASAALAADFALPTRFVQGSYVPEESDAYTRLACTPDDFGVIFAYPWPHEVEKTQLLFERVAGAQALLLTYHSGVEFRAQRKSGTAHGHE
jgi:hypothetical protein